VFVSGKRIAVKHNLVKLVNSGERDRLNELILKGKRSAQLLTTARIPLEGGRIGWPGEGW